MTATVFHFDRTTTTDFERGAALEWIETNGIGGWASSTILSAHSRRYHGLLVAAVKPPHERQVLVSKLDETIVTGSSRYELGCNRFPGTVHPQGFQHLKSFTKQLLPVWEYEVSGIRLRKTVCCVQDENTTIVLYEALEAAGEFTLELRPFVAPRDYHSLARANETLDRSVNFDRGTLTINSYQGVPKVFIHVPGSEFSADGEWYYNFEYSWEQARGLDFQEDLFTHGKFQVRLRKGASVGVIVSTEDSHSRDGAALIRAELARKQQFLNSKAGSDEFLGTLLLAADQFIVSRGDKLKTVIAGYHWFADWGRDTMIALPGLCLVTGRFEDARNILRAFAKSVSDGMLPNRFTDDGIGAEYNSVDASLWFFVAVHKYLQYTEDLKFVQSEILPALQEIAQRYESGTRYGIHQEQNGLVYAGEAGVQLTWMDAKVGDLVITPRIGAPIEINALWYNALRILADILEQSSARRDAVQFRRRAERVKEAFVASFWNEQTGGLYDCINGMSIDRSIRPNQIFALSLPYPLLSTGKARRVLQLVEDRLLTPVGLRSLDPHHQDYKGHYEGGVFTRDSAYHQGTVWSWLLGPYISALLRFGGDQARTRASKIMTEFRVHLNEAGVGTVSEIFDGDAPFAPQGCIAQAWGVAEILRSYIEDLGAGMRHGTSDVSVSMLSLD